MSMFRIAISIRGHSACSLLQKSSTTRSSFIRVNREIWDEGKEQNKNNETKRRTTIERKCLTVNGIDTLKVRSICCVNRAKTLWFLHSLFSFFLRVPSIRSIFRLKCLECWESKRVCWSDWRAAYVCRSLSGSVRSVRSQTRTHIRRLSFTQG